MSEINVNIVKLNSGIARMQRLQSKCSGTKTAKPATVGGGKTVNELENMAGTYEKLNVHLEKLLSNTTSFLENVRDSYISSDEKAGSAMKK